MRSACLVAILVLHGVYAEEVLSSRPLVISPKRIETKTVLPPKVIANEPAKKEPKITKKPEPKIVQKAKTEEPFVINMNNVILKIAFNPGSIQLSDDARTALKNLGLKSGQKIRISGFGESGRKNAKKVANFRARVVASYLDEALGGISADLQWNGDPHSCCVTDGVIIEKVQ